MSNDRPTNIGASTFEHVRREAKRRGRDVQAEAQSHAIRRFMARLMQVDADGRTTVKGGQALGLLFGNDRRPTKDLDLNVDCKGMDRPDEWVRELIDDACALDGDGVVFRQDSVMIEQREHQGLGGYRITIQSSIHSCRTPFVIDVGMGNQMSFKPISLRLAEPHPHAPPPTQVRVYPIETTFAEKLLAKVEDGAASIRHKDFYDMWHIHEIADRIGNLEYLTSNSLDLDDEELAWRDMVAEKIRSGDYGSLERRGISEESLERFAFALYRSSLSRGTTIPEDLMSFLRSEFSLNGFQADQFGNWIKNQKQRLIHLPPGAESAETRSASLGMLLDDIEDFVTTVAHRARHLAAAHGEDAPEWGGADTTMRI